MPAPAAGEQVDEPEAVCIARAMALVATAGRGAAHRGARGARGVALHAARRSASALPVDAVLRARLGGWLHDIGKAAIPRGILDKPGPLDDEEWAVMRTHPAIGEALVCDVAALRDAAPAVRHHHERWDGGGYPDGLAGEAIPVEARIVAAADAYAAMTAERVYSAARTPLEAADELRRSAGSHLDPRRGGRAARRARPGRAAGGAGRLGVRRAAIVARVRSMLGHRGQAEVSADVRSSTDRWRSGRCCSPGRSCRRVTESSVSVFVTRDRVKVTLTISSVSGPEGIEITEPGHRQGGIRRASLHLYVATAFGMFEPGHLTGTAWSLEYADQNKHTLSSLGGWVVARRRRTHTSLSDTATGGCRRSCSLRAGTT